MFAKLTFNPGTAVGGKIRDIVRLITESAAGTASLSNLEFINTDGSELYTGTNSGWVLASGSATLPVAGTAVSAAVGGDGIYYLEGSCVTSSKKKHVAITLNGSYSVATNTTASIVVQDVLDYGTATELRTAGYTSTQTARLPYFGIAPSTANSQTVYISATPRKLIIIGDANSGQRMFAHLEFPETGMTTYYNTRPCVFLSDSTGGSSTNSTTSNNYATSGSSGVGYNDYSHRALYFNQCLYDTEASLAVRSYMVNDYGYNARYTPYIMYHENGTLYGTNIASGNFYNNMARFKHGSAPEDYRAMYANLNASGSSYKGELYTTNDQKILPLYPMHYDGAYVAAGDMNFSELTNIYIMPKIGLWGDKMVIGSDNYYLFPFSTANYTIKLD